MAKTVAVLGGGVGGLSAAHELAERGFQVAVYESKPVFGGKARSIPVPDSGTSGRKNLPGEHGFRFFPSFYKHITDTMKRIPYGANPQGVFDNLIATTRTRVARAGMKDIILSARFPVDANDWATNLKAFFQSMDLHLPDSEILFFIDRLLTLLTSCQERRVTEYENITWWDFLDANNKSSEYQRFLAEGQTRTLVAMRAEEGSARSVGYIFLQLLFGIILPGGSFDRLLNGPTSDVWIDPWTAYLQKLGVALNPSVSTRAFHVDSGRITKVSGDRNGTPLEIEADYYIAAMPVEVMTRLWAADDLKAAAPSMAHLASLRTAWMNGIQFYLEKDVPVVNGHTVYNDSPWALTSVSQRQFWQGFDLGAYGTGHVGGILSVDISNWEKPGILYGKPAMQCTAEEIKTETWEQLKAHLNDEGAAQLEDANVLAWFLDPDIQWPNPNSITNLEPLLINTVGSLKVRPDATTELPNLFLASDYVRTYTDLATMEGANEAARRSVNAILDRTQSGAPRCSVWPLKEPDFFKPMLDYDRLRYKLGLPHSKLV